MDPAGVRASATGIDRAADAVRRAAHPRHAADVATALPGSASAHAARRVQARWSAAAGTWAAGAAAQSARIVAAVTDTQARDAAVAATAGRLAARLGATP